MTICAQILNDLSCILCKRNLEHVIMTADKTTKFEDYPIWGDTCKFGGRELAFDEESQVFLSIGV